jgi:hypothetical protein
MCRTGCPGQSLLIVEIGLQHYRLGVRGAVIPEYRISSIGLDGYVTNANNFECTSDREGVKMTDQIAEGTMLSCGSVTVQSPGCFRGKSEIGGLNLGAP